MPEHKIEAFLLVSPLLFLECNLLKYIVFQMTKKSIVYEQAKLCLWLRVARGKLYGLMSYLSLVHVSRNISLLKWHYKILDIRDGNSLTFKRKFEGTKWLLVIRSRKSRKDRQYNGQMITSNQKP